MIEAMISSSVLILAVCLLRFVLRGRVSPGYLYSLWGLVGLRLVLPWLYPLRRLPGMVKSRFSVMGAVHAVREQVIEGTMLEPLADNLATGKVYIFDETAAPVTVTEKVVQRAAGIDWQLWIVAVWVLGSVILAGWMAGVTIRFYRKLMWNRRLYRGKLPDFVTRQVYVADFLESPCYFGLGAEEAIYLPEFMENDEEKVCHALAHEMGHVRHGDRCWGILRCVLLCYYWINPFVWIGVILSRRDCELACDEAAIQMLGEKERYAYGRTLVGLAAEQKTSKNLFSMAVSMGSGKRTIRERIQVLAKHPGRTGKAAAVLIGLAAVLAACTFTGRSDKDGTSYDDPYKDGQGGAQEQVTAGTEENRDRAQTETEENRDRAQTEAMVLAEERQYGILYVLTLKRDSQEAENQNDVLADPGLDVDVICYEDAAGTNLLGNGHPHQGYSYSLAEDGLEVEFLNAQHAASCRIVVESGDDTLEYLFVTHDPEPFAMPESEQFRIFAKNDMAVTLQLAEVYSNMVYLRLVGESVEAASRFQTENVVSLKLAGTEDRYETPQWVWQDGSVLELIYCLDEEIDSADQLEAIVTGSGNSRDGYIVNRLDYQRVHEVVEKFRAAYAEGNLEEAEQYLGYPNEKLEKYPIDSRWNSVTTNLHILEDKPVFAEAECIFQTEDEKDGTWKLSLWIHKVSDGWKIEQLSWSQENVG